MDKWYAFIAGFVTLAGYAAFAGALVALSDERRRVRRLRDDLDRVRDQTESVHDALETERDMRVTLHEECLALTQKLADAEQTTAALREQLRDVRVKAFLFNGLEKYATLLKDNDPFTAALNRANEYGLLMLCTAEECLRPDAQRAEQVPPDMEVPEARSQETAECP